PEGRIRPTGRHEDHAERGKDPTRGGLKSERVGNVPVRETRRIALLPDLVRPITREDATGYPELYGLGQVGVDRQQRHGVRAGGLRHAGKNATGRAYERGVEREGIVVTENLAVERIEREGESQRAEQ